MKNYDNNWRQEKKNFLSDFLAQNFSDDSHGFVFKYKIHLDEFLKWKNVEKVKKKSFVLTIINCFFVRRVESLLLLNKILRKIEIYCNFLWHFFMLLKKMKGLKSCQLWVICKFDLISLWSKRQFQSKIM
jgi:hypothetical protein